MINDISSIVDDIIQLNLGVLNIGKLRDKYNGTIEPKVSIKEVLDYVNLNKLENSFVENVFYGDFRDKQLPFLLKVKNGFEVFDSERGSKHGLELYGSLNAALFDYFDRMFNEIGHVATDSVINS